MSDIQETQKPAPKEPAFTILGTLGFDKVEDLDQFTEKLDIQSSILLLIHATNYAQAKGCYNFAEASVIAKAIRNLVKTAEPKKQDTPTT